MDKKKILCELAKLDRLSWEVWTVVISLLEFATVFSEDKPACCMETITEYPCCFCCTAGPWFCLNCLDDFGLNSSNSNLRSLCSI